MLNDCLQLTMDLDTAYAWLVHELARADLMFNNKAATSEQRFESILMLNHRIGETLSLSNTAAEAAPKFIAFLEELDVREFQSAKIVVGGLCDTMPKLTALLRSASAMLRHFLDMESDLYSRLLEPASEVPINAQPNFEDVIACKL